MSRARAALPRSRGGPLRRGKVSTIRRDKSASDNNDVHRIVLLGPPGAGKGTQGERLSRRWNALHISSGDILRRIIATEDSDLARAARVILDGKLISDEVANAIIFRELEKPQAAERGFILDGYPRNVAQAGALDTLLSGNRLSLDRVVALEIDENTQVERLTGRLTCPNCGMSYHVRHEPPRVPGICDRCGAKLVVREDDRPEKIRTRFAIYHEKTEPLIAYYRERGLLSEIVAVGTEDEVFHRILTAVESKTGTADD